MASKIQKRGLWLLFYTHNYFYKKINKQEGVIILNYFKRIEEHQINKGLFRLYKSNSAWRSNAEHRTKIKVTELKPRRGLHWIPQGINDYMDCSIVLTLLYQLYESGPSKSKEAGMPKLFGLLEITNQKYSPKRPHHMQNKNITAFNHWVNGWGDWWSWSFLTGREPQASMTSLPQMYSIGKFHCNL